jgi:hypothetical protein
MEDEYIEPLEADEKPKQESKKRRISKIPRWLKLLIGVPLAIIAILYAVFWYFELRPQYVVLDVPVYGDIEWDNTMKITLRIRPPSSAIVDEDAYDKYWVWRYQGKYDCYFDCPNENDLLIVYETWLLENGWEFSGVETGGVIIHESGICSIGFPEFSSSGQIIDVLIFRQEGEYKTTACLAVWSIDHQWEKSVNVVIATSNASILSMMYEFGTF